MYLDIVYDKAIYRLRIYLAGALLSYNLKLGREERGERDAEKAGGGTEPKIIDENLKARELEEMDKEVKLVKGNGFQGKRKQSGGNPTFFMNF